MGTTLKWLSCNFGRHRRHRVGRPGRPPIRALSWHLRRLAGYGCRSDQTNLASADIPTAVETGPPELRMEAALAPRPLVRLGRICGTPAPRHPHIVLAGSNRDSVASVGFVVTPNFEADKTVGISANDFAI